MSDRLGVIFDEPFDEYLAHAAFGTHDLADLRPHPILFAKKHVWKTIKADKDSEPKAFGRYFHALALEGEEAAEARFAMTPENAPQRPQARWLAAKVPKQEYIDAEAWWQNWFKENAGKQMIDRADRDLAWRMVESIRGQLSLVALLDPARGKPEVTFRCQMKHFQLQCRSDWFIEKPIGNGPPMDVNLKSISRLSEFDRQFLDFEYYRGVAFYRAVMAKCLKLEVMEPQLAFLVVEKEEPFQCCLRIPDVESLNQGWREVERDLMTMRDCFEQNIWPGEPDQPRPVSLPEWYMKRVNPL